ncbi:MAG: PSD1 domain-containing protein [Planctomycetes bacterium]|nr:PSD1 domain-containing protein [Planctomycetota bacterium]
MRLAVLLALAFAAASAVAQESTALARDVRSLLSQRCFACHGPATAKSSLRLDRREDALRGGKSGVPGVVPGEPERSELVRRVRASDAEERMPPIGEHAPLDAEEVALLERWIEAGAPDAGHWSFAPLAEVAVPPPSARARGPIDAFVEEELQRQGYSLAPPAPRGELLRRLSLDLIGLPPTPDELARFVADPAPEALEREVDRLLASPHFGERAALPWLDLARYADTNGFSIDDHRDMWAWRDGLIDALNENQPYPRFVLEQLAGDLLPDADERTRLSTGFLRNSMSTHEGGTLPEEYRVIYLADKVDAVATSFLGLTLRCAQCHDHKYDPLSQEDYYRFYAFFDRAIEPGMGGENGNAEPHLQVRSPLVDPERVQREARERIATLERYRLHPPELVELRARWIEEQRQRIAPPEDAAVELVLPQWIWAEKNPTSVRFERAIELAGDLRALRLQLACDNRARVLWNGVELARSDDWQRPLTVELPLAAESTSGMLVVHAENQGGPAGLVALLELERASGVERLPSDASWAAFDGAGERLATQVIAAHGEAPWGRVLPLPDEALAAALHAAQPSDAQWRVLNAAHAAVEPRWKGHGYALASEIASLRATAESGRVSTMVMGEEPSPRTTYVLLRGQYDQPDRTRPVEPGVPEAVFAWDRSLPRDRLGLARWIADLANPLAPRVAVNRLWQMMFGAGLVATSNDFGAQGALPSHPELLDFLAARFLASGGDTKALLREIALSATYAQSSHLREEHLARDPANRWLSRGVRRRLDAELLRDQALFLGGLLDLRLGGASVFPTQPEGLWQELSHFGHPAAFTAQAQYPSVGTDRFRRSLYTFWKRTAPPPSLLAFDAPTREVCVAYRARTNTPLQALVALNDPEHVEAARGFAQRAMSAEEGTAERVRWMFAAATARPPSARELERLVALHEHARLELSHRPEDALALVASTLLNLDETLTQH